MQQQLHLFCLNIFKPYNQNCTARRRYQYVYTSKTKASSIKKGQYLWKQVLFFSQKTTSKIDFYVIF